MGSSSISSITARPTLIIFGGLPATGKTTLARALARSLGGTYLRIDSIEQALRGIAETDQPINEEGYAVAYALAEDNLRLGRLVIADSVNPVRQSRDAWLDVACRTLARAIEVEIVCSDIQQHRERLEARAGEIRGLQAPSWEAVVSRNYEPWQREHIVIDTAGRSPAQSVEDLQRALLLHEGWGGVEAKPVMKD